MGDEHGVVGHTPKPVARKRGVYAAHQNFGCHVADEEYHGYAKRADHAVAMSVLIAIFDQNKPRREEHGRDGVQGGVQLGEERNKGLVRHRGFSLFIKSSMLAALRLVTCKYLYNQEW